MMHQSLYGTLGGNEQLSAVIAAQAAAQASAATDPSAKDTTFTKIFVGGLPYHTTDQTLNEFFARYGDIEEAVVITDRQTGKSRGYGFVTMRDRAGAERACKDPNPIIDGRKANVNLAYLGAKPRGNVQLASLQFPHQVAQLQAALLAQQRAAQGMGATPLYSMAGAGAGGGMMATSPTGSLLALNQAAQPAVSAAAMQAAAALQLQNQLANAAGGGGGGYTDYASVLSQIYAQNAAAAATATSAAYDPYAAYHAAYGATAGQQHNAANALLMAHAAADPNQRN